MSQCLYHAWHTSWPVVDNLINDGHSCCHVITVHRLPLGSPGPVKWLWQTRKRVPPVAWRRSPGSTPAWVAREGFPELHQRGGQGIPGRGLGAGRGWVSQAGPSALAALRLRVGERQEMGLLSRWPSGDSLSGSLTRLRIFLGHPFTSPQ
jgi:hypothetical protein